MEYLLNLKRLFSKQYGGDMKKSVERTDVYGEFAIWLWGKTIPTEIFECQRFIRKSPLGKYIKKLEKEVINAKQK